MDILKGSQPIYGTAAVGGVINYQSLRPTDTWQALGRFEAGNHEQLAGEAQIAGPLTEHIGVALTASGYRTEGYSSQTDAGSPFGGNPDAESLVTLWILRKILFVEPMPLLDLS